MAQAQFIGPTPAQISADANSQLMQGLSQLQQYGQFASEQARLKKVEEVKNKTNSFLLTAQRFGDGDATLGLKALSEEMPDYVKNYLGLIGYTPDMAGQVVDLLKSSEPTSREHAKFLTEALQKLAPANAVPAAGGGSAATQVDLKTEGQPAVASEGQPAKPAKGQFLDLWEWDKAARGDYGLGVQEGIKTIGNLQGKYQPVMQAMGIPPENQGQPGDPRMMTFSSGTAAALRTKLLAQKAQLGVKIGQVQDQDQTKKQRPPWLLPSGGPGIKELIAKNAALDLQIQQLDADAKVYGQSIKVIDASRGPDAARLAAAGEVNLNGLTAEQAGTAANRSAAEPVLAPGSQQAQPAIAAQAAPVASAGPATQALNTTIQTSADLSTSQPADLRKAQLFSEQLKTAVTREAYISLARQDPQGAQAFARWKLSDDAYIGMISLMADPKGEVEYQRKLKSGEIQAGVEESRARTALARQQVDMMPKQLEVLSKQADAALAQAQASMEGAKTGLDIAKANVQEAWARVDVAKLQVQAAQFDQSWAPMKMANDTYIKSTQDFNDLVIRLPKDKSGKLIADQQTAVQMQIAINHVNASITQLNAIGLTTMKAKWATISTWSNVELKDVNKWWQVNRDHFELVSSTPAVTVGGTATPVPAAVAGPSAADQEAASYTPPR